MFSPRINAIGTLSIFFKSKELGQGQNKSIETCISCPPTQNGGTFCDFCQWELKNMDLSDLVWALNVPPKKR